MPGDCFRVANFFKARLVDVLARCLLLEKLPVPIFTFVAVMDMWGANVLLCINDPLVRNHRYDYFVASRLGLATGGENMRAQKQIQTAAAE